MRTIASSTIDVHSHAIPPFLVREYAQAANAPMGLKVMVERGWMPSDVIDSLDHAGGGSAVLSGIPLHEMLIDMQQGEASALVRRLNEYLATTRGDHRARFGFFSYLPMPDVEATLKEIEYSLDTLKADGIGLFTSYGEKSISDPEFFPVLEELNARGSVVFCHPDLPCGCDKPVSQVQGHVRGMIGYPYDTGRAVFGLLLSGSLLRFRNIRWIFCHGGGPVPVLAGRISNMLQSSGAAARLAPDGVEGELRRLYFDVANASNAAPMAALLATVPSSQVLFGSDAPYFGVEPTLKSLLENDLSAGDLEAILHGNAATLLPGLAKA